MTLWACMKCAKGNGRSITDHDTITATPTKAPDPRCRTCSSTLTAIDLDSSYHKKVVRKVKSLLNGGAHP